MERKNASPSPHGEVARSPRLAQREQLESLLTWPRHSPFPGVDCGLELGTKEARLGKDCGADKTDLSTPGGASSGSKVDAEQIGP